jgi:hypothetical protein
MSSPASSSSSVTRRPIVFLMSQNVPKLIANTNVNAIEKPTTWAISWVNLPEYTRPPSGSPKALYWARRGAVKMPHEIVPQIPARPCAESAPTGSSMILSMA